jgi:type VI protein secretion system component Hcp
MLAALPPVTAPPLTLELQSSSLPAVTLGLDSYKFGLINRFTHLSLDVLAPLSGASPQLFAALLAQRRYDTAVLTQRNAAGDPVAEWVLGNPILTLDEPAGKGSAVPTESLQLAFDAVTEVTSAHAGSWNMLTQNNVGPAAPDGVTLAALPAPTAPTLTLELQPSSASTLPAVTLELDSYYLGSINKPTFDSATGGSAAGKAILQDLAVSVPLNGAVPQLFAALVAGRSYSTAVLTQRNAAGDPVAEWVLGNSSLLSVDNVSGDGSAVPTEALHITYASATEVTSDRTVSWNQITNSRGGPTPPAGVTLVPLGAITPTVAIVDNGGVYNGAAFDVTAATVSAGGTTLATLGDSSLTFTYYVGSSAAGPGSATAPMDAGTYTVVAHFSSTKPSYYTDADSAPVVFTITPAPLAVTVDSATRAYGQPNPPLTGTVTGVLNQDDVAIVYSTTADQSSDVRAGGYTITASSLTGAAAHNYSLDPGVVAGAAVTNGTLTVTAVPLTITADNQTKIAGEANPTFTASYSGFVLGQGPDALGGALTLSTLATASSPPGLYVITPGGLTSGNYAITFAGGTLTVLSAGQATNEVLFQVNAASLPSALKSALASQLQAAIDLFNQGKTIPGVTLLSTFMQHVRAQRGKKIDVGLADVLIAAAQRIIDAVG